MTVTRLVYGLKRKAFLFQKFTASRKIIIVLTVHLFGTSLMVELANVY